jgi:cyclic pyranopterin phosphate synthase
MDERVLYDPSRRRVDYLRISITDRCNERCVYCMPEGLKDWKERDEILTYEEILRVVEIAVRLGFRKFRVTGGEPLVRRDAVDFLRRLGAVRGIESLGLSTNGTLLAPAAEEIRRAGVQAVNISLDTLDPGEYRRLTRWDLADCLAGIEAARSAGFASIKLNAVLMRGVNEEQILPLIRFAREHDAVIRFIELMPVTTTEVLTRENFLPVEEARRAVERELSLERVDVRLGHGPAVYYRTADGGMVGFIGAMTDLHFCELCNKVRLTADGKIRPCLGSHLEFDLREVLRAGGDDREVEEVFRRSLGLKPAEHDFRGQYQPGRSMTAIGG